jgi:hypothetical protein
MMVGTLCASMVLGSSVTAFASEEGTTTSTPTTTENVVTSSGSSATVNGAGAVEGYVDTDVFKVVLPTSVTTGTSALDFTLDPQKLIGQAAVSAGEQDNTDGATVFFNNDGGTQSDTSDEFTVTNKGTVAVDVALTATVTGLTDGTSKSAYTIGLAKSDDLENDTKSNIYLGVIVNDGSNDTTTELENEKTVIKNTIAAAPAGSYQIEKTSSGYEYNLISGASGFSSLTYKLEGACNTKGDWSATADAKPAVSFVWKVSEQDLAGFASSAKGVITYTASKVTSVKSINMVSCNSTTKGKSFDVYNVVAKGWNAATDENGTITLDTANVIKAMALTGDTDAEITYVDDKGKTKTTTITVKLTD